MLRVHATACANLRAATPTCCWRGSGWRTLPTRRKSTLDGIVRATNILLAGKCFVVAGYDKDINTIEEGIADAVSETKCFDDIIVQQDAKLADVIKQVSATRTKLDTLVASEG